MKKKIFVDTDLCKGHDNGRCAQIAPEAFDCEGDYPEVVNDEEIDFETIEELIDSCPSGAIKFVDD